ncbi:GlsB/YeaQ/YmgE family stress response membrane protein [Lentisalinibacter orientalis]|uniref:GlsB/YeaQ/YmgE family stress response membrane protein n=1 Tax=Lentisalinibacter orientalis TaxID=2992241 RepID=UPI00386DB869
MNIVLWLVIGGLVGWQAIMLTRTESLKEIILNVVVGMIGAVLGGWIPGRLFGAGPINEGNFNMTGLLVSLFGAVLLLTLVRFARDDALR